jgi:SAM-dependent methyltransferase
MTDDQRTAMPEFITYNIELPDGRFTCPKVGLLCRNPLYLGWSRTLNLLYPPEQRDGIRMLDLGCNEGGFSLLFAQAGFHVVGLEARDKNLDCANYLKLQFQLANLEFHKADVRQASDFGVFDIVLCSGVLYHMDSPVSFLQQISACTKRIIIVDTHFSMGSEPPPQFALEGLSEHEGKPGRWYKEPAEVKSAARTESARWASYGNERSFWLDKFALLETLREVGFTLIFEQYDVMPRIGITREPAREWRSTFVGIKGA